jgi:hypothetical protein
VIERAQRIGGATTRIAPPVRIVRFPTYRLAPIRHRAAGVLASLGALIRGLVGTIAMTCHNTLLPVATLASQTGFNERRESDAEIMPAPENA